MPNGCLDAADLPQRCEVRFLPTPAAPISCPQNNARTDNREKVAGALRLGNRCAGLGLLPGSARMSRHFDGKRLLSGIVAKRLKGILVQRFQ